MKGYKVQNIKIEISQDTAEQLQKIYDRYYFGLFEGTVKNEDEEMQIRDALQELSKAINSK